jgi:hypothetical protein
VRFKRINHLAGIVPVEKQRDDFNMPWHSSMMPIYKDYMAIERAIHECAYVGCNTIWVVCDEPLQPFMRERLKNSILDPFLSQRQKEKYGHIRNPYDIYIPIFYVARPLYEWDKEPTLIKSILHGANTALNISSNIARWLKSRRYYVSFPYSVNSYIGMRELRKKLMTDRPVLMRSGNKTVLDNELLPFTFGNKDLEGFNKNIDVSYKKYGERYFNLGVIKNNLSLTGKIFFDTKYYFPIDTWGSYCVYLGESVALRKDEIIQFQFQHKQLNTYPIKGLNINVR